MIPVKDQKHLVRDTLGAIKNVDNEGFHAFIAQREARLAEKQRLDAMENDIKSMKSTMEAILEALQGNKK